MKLDIFSPVAVFKKAEEGGYTVFCPQVQGVFSEGDTMEEARAMIKDALEGVLHVALEEGRERYFSHQTYQAKRGELVEPIDIDPRLRVAVSICMAREQAGLTQKQLAAKIGVRQQHISRYEKGRVSPSAEMFLKLISLAH